MPTKAPSDPEFDLLFLGTGAADHDWDHYGRRGVRGSCATLLNGRILIDCGATGFRSLVRWGVDPRSLREIWFTHSHGDHCSTREISALLAARGRRAKPLLLRGTKALLEHLSARLPVSVARFDCRPVEPLESFRTTGLRVAALPANHFTGLPEETPVHWLVLGRRKNLLYALDGAWMTTAARKAIGGTRLDLVVWDATVRDAGDWRMFEHNDLGMVRAMAARLAKDGVLGPSSVQVLDHLSRELWPPPVRAPRPFRIARDGLRLRV